jgi:hypothetical protein
LKISTPNKLLALVILLFVVVQWLSFKQDQEMARMAEELGIDLEAE